jgi:hypothetical protein
MWYAHGLYNAIVFVLFVWQGWLGAKIRTERLNGAPPIITAIRRHRKFGSVVFLLGIAGFLSGVFIIYFTKGHILVQPPHFVAGSILTLLIMLAFFLSKRIRGRSSPWRIRHFAAGTATICVYIIQIYLGIKILF